MTGSDRTHHFGHLRSEDLPIGQLLLDSENPRLPPELRLETSQETLAMHMAEIFDALSIARSIARYGYYPWEALVVVPEGDLYVVVEGNRRLTAVRGLSDASLRSRFEHSNSWNEATELAAGDVPTAVPCVIVETRREAAPALGYRHISGIKPWEPQMQARFVAALIEQEGRTFEEVAELVGQSRLWVQDTYSTFKVFETAEEVGVDTVAAADSYSLLTVAMGTPELRRHIGAERNVPERGEAIARPDKERISELFQWVFGNDEEEPVASESREIRNLAKVIAKPAGLDAIRSGSSLEEARQRIEDDEYDRTEVVRRDLAKAEQLLSRITLDGDSVGDEVVSVTIDGIVEQVQRLMNELDAEAT